MSTYRKRIVRTPKRTRALYSIKQFVERNPSWTESAIRAIRSKAKTRHSSLGVIQGNGFGSAFLKIGNKVLVDEHEFFRIIRERNQTSNSTFNGHKGRGND